MAELKTRENDADVGAFLAAIEDEQKRADCEAICAMMQRASGAPARMWGASIVGFGHYDYRYESGRTGTWMRIGFAPRKRDITLYIMPGFDDFDGLMARLGKHRTGKSCLYVKRLSDLDRDVLQTIVERSLDAMREKYPEGD